MIYKQRHYKTRCSMKYQISKNEILRQTSDLEFLSHPEGPTDQTIDFFDQLKAWPRPSTPTNSQLPGMAILAKLAQLIFRTLTGRQYRTWHRQHVF